MPFQFVALGLRANTGTPLSKLVWLWLLQNCEIEDAPNGKAFINCDMEPLYAFAQAPCEPVWDAIDLLRRLGLLGYVNLQVARGGPPDELFADLNLPISSLRQGDRKRIKCTPDQVEALTARAGDRCPGCAAQFTGEETWHVDHIIPRAKGGADVEENCQVLCPTCNSKKGARTGWVDFL